MKTFEGEWWRLEHREFLFRFFSSVPPVPSVLDQTFLVGRLGQLGLVFRSGNFFFLVDQPVANTTGFCLADAVFGFEASREVLFPKGLET